MEKTLTTRKQLDQTVKQYILEAISNQGYDNAIPLTDEVVKLTFLKGTFKSEYGWSIARYGEQKAFREYIMGLPSSFNVDFENYKILQLAHKWGSIKEGLSERALAKREDLILENWFNFITVKTFQLFRKYGIN